MNKLIDNYKRHINYLRISITDRCNLRCIYCMPIDGISHLSHEDILSYEEIVRIARIAVKEGITKIRITGGEPLVRKGVVNLVGWLSQLEGIEDLSMTTNGILLSEFAKPLYEAGLKRVNVSMDSLKPDRFREITRGGELSSLISGIEKANEAGMSPIKINVVAMKGFNEDEILDFAQLTKERNCQVRFIEFMPVGLKNGWKEERYLSCSSIKKIIQENYKLHQLDNKRGNGGPADLYRLENAKGIIGFINAISSHFCSTCNRLRLTADGKLRPCLFSDKEFDIRMAMRQGDSDEELRSLLHTALSNKPEGHAITKPTFKKCAREMVKIGG
ncbi:MAG: GTP 3',8-cyclase MoaA [Deltaproteobacteria bacterium]|nr:GTP 3',8-cyclase MoaA [Deltaproteobacteria bacterium]